MRLQDSSISSAASSPFSSISTTSFASSSLNSPSLLSSSSTELKTHCEGLDLLVKAVLYTTGSVLGIRFTQRRVIRRRKRAFRFIKMVSSEIGDKEEDKKVKKEMGIEMISKPKRRKRLMALPSKYHDSVLQPWKRCSRRQTIDRESEIDERLG